MGSGCARRTQPALIVTAMIAAIIALAALCLPQGAPAQTSAAAQDDPAIVRYFGGGIATAAEVRQLTGPVRYEMTNCPPKEDIADERAIAVTISKTLQTSLYEHPSVADALLSNAAHYVWTHCPQQFWFVGKPNGEFQRNIQAVRIVNGDGSLLLSARLGGASFAQGDRTFSPGSEYSWRDVQDEFSIQRANAARESALAVRREQERSQAEANANTLKTGFWRLVKIIVGGWIAILLFSSRQAIAEWLYSLTPHPATQQVDEAINSGLPIDGELFAAVNQPYDNNKYEINVRNRQANVLTERLRRHEAALRTQSRAIIKKESEKVRLENAFLQAHEALINAGVDHETAAAHLEALRKATGQ